MRRPEMVDFQHAQSAVQYIADNFHRRAARSVCVLG